MINFILKDNWWWQDITSNCIITLCTTCRASSTRHLVSLVTYIHACIHIWKECLSSFLLKAFLFSCLTYISRAFPRYEMEWCTQFSKNMWCLRCIMNQWGHMQENVLFCPPSDAKPGGSSRFCRAPSYPKHPMAGSIGLLKPWTLWAFPWSPPLLFLTETTW